VLHTEGNAWAVQLLVKDPMDPAFDACRVGNTITLDWHVHQVLLVPANGQLAYCINRFSLKGNGCARCLFSLCQYTSLCGI
jgi:hypothetical protein